MKTHRFLVTFFICWTCIVLTAVDSSGGTYGTRLKRYSAENAAVKRFSESVDQPSSYSKRIASELIGRWKTVSLLSSNDQAKVVLKTLAFRKDGTVEYIYELKDKQKTISKIEEYQVVHRGSPRHSGKAPSMIFRNADLTDDSVLVFVRVNVGYGNRFPMSWGKVLTFTDLDGNQFAFVREKQMPGQGDQAEVPIDVPTVSASGKSTLVKPVPASIRNPMVTKELVAALTEGNLSDHKKNKTILRLMNEGDSTCVPLLIDLSTNVDNPLVIRQNAIRALGKIGDKKAVSPLVKILEQSVEGDVQDEAEDEAIIRRNAVNALGYIGDASALPILKRIAESTQEYQSVREDAGIAIRKIEEKK